MAANGALPIMEELEREAGARQVELLKLRMPDIDGLAVTRAVKGESPKTSVIHKQLTAREHDVLRLVVLGHTNREIAETLRLTVSTVKTHVEHVLGKLGVSDRTQAAVRAIEMGLVTPDSC